MGELLSINVGRVAAAAVGMAVVSVAVAGDSSRLCDRFVGKCSISMTLDRHLQVFVDTDLCLFLCQCCTGHGSGPSNYQLSGKRIVAGPGNTSTEQRQV